MITMVKPVQFRAPNPKVIFTFITNTVVGSTLRNDTSASLGLRFSTSRQITITDIGRFVIAGNSQSHSLTIVTDNRTTTLATVSVNCSGANPGRYLYGHLSTPLVLAAGTYHCWSSEVNGGDQWYNFDCALTPTGIGSVIQASFGGGNTGSTGNSYVPTNFKYF